MKIFKIARNNFDWLGFTSALVVMLAVIPGCMTNRANISPHPWEIPNVQTPVQINAPDTEIALTSIDCHLNLGSLYETAEL